MSPRLVFAALLFLTGCATTAGGIPELGPPTRIVRYENGQLTDDPIAPGSQEEATFQEWLKQNQTGWTTNHTTRIAADGTRICGQDYYLVCGDSLYALNYRLPGTQSWQQVTKAVDDDHDGLRLIQGTVQDDD